jgi:hypothetical protein
VAQRDRSAEESHGMLVLQQHLAKPVGRGVSLHNERQCEVGWARTGADVMACFRESNAVVASRVQVNTSLRNRAVSGAAMVPNSRTNLR